MKLKFVSVIPLLFYGIMLNAQNDPGTKTIGVGVFFGDNEINYKRTNYKDEINYTYAGFYISSGYYITDKSEIGLNCGYSYGKSKHFTEYDFNRSDSKQNNYFLNFYPYYRRFLLESEKWKPYVSLNSGIAFIWNNSDNSFSYKSNAYGLKIGVNLGLIHLFSDHWSCDVEMGGISFQHSYQKSKYKSTYTGDHTSKSTGNSINYGFSLSNLSFGFRYHF